MFERLNSRLGSHVVWTENDSGCQESPPQPPQQLCDMGGHCFPQFAMMETRAQK